MKDLQQTDRIYPTLEQARRLVTTLSQDETASWMGAVHTASILFKDIPAGGVRRAQFTIPMLSSGHLIALRRREIWATAGPFDIMVYGNPTGMVKGALALQHCLRLFYPTTSLVDVTQVVSVTSPGTLITEDSPGGQAGGPGGGAPANTPGSSQGEFILIENPGSVIYYEMTNASEQIIERARFSIDWVQVPLDYIRLDGFIETGN